MLKKSTVIALIVFCLALSLMLVGCNGDSGNGGNNDTDNGTTDGGNTDTDGDGGNSDTEGGDDTDGNGGSTDGIDWDNTGLEGLALVFEGKARFRVVYTSESGTSALRLANNFVKDLRTLGVEVGDAISDQSADDVTDCEIIIGTSVRHRGEELSISERELGKDGFCVKIVGNKILIAGGSTEKLESVFDYYKKNEMGITKKTKAIKELAVDPAYSQLTYTEYDVSYVRIGTKELRDYVIVQDFGDLDTKAFALDNIKDFREDLYNTAGYWLDCVSVSDMDNYDNRIIFRYVSDKSAMDESGFKMYVDGSDFIIECSYANAFDSTYYSCMYDLVLGKTSPVTIATDYSKTVNVSVARYEDFGAVGDGIYNDYDAIMKTHVYANAGGQKVVGKEGTTYRVGPMLPNTVPIMTDVDFNGCTFLIDDVGDAAYQTRTVSLFTLTRDHPVVELTEKQIDEIAGTDATIKFGDTSVPWLADYIETKSLVMFTNTHHKDFIRHGANQTSGEPRKDVFIMYPDGSIDPETEVCFEFDNFTLVQIHRVDDAPVTVENGNFINICCRTVSDTDFTVRYKDYARGFKFERSNVTFKNVTHRMQDEPELNFNVNSQYGGCNESYPYYAFIYTERTYNLLVEDCSLTGHTTYYQPGRATASTGGVVSNPIPAGTYDIAVERSVNVHFLNTHQYAPNGLGDSRYWGIMTSNWTKDMTFENCSINRFDAHRSFWGARLIDTDIGHTINLVGGGELYMERVRKIVGSVFIQTRGDYGGTFRGNITLIDCTLEGTNTYRSNTGGVYNPASKAGTGYVVSIGYDTDNETGYWDWFFGFPSYMPESITLKNFTTGCTGYTYVYPELPDEVFTAGKYPLHVAKSVTFIDMKPLEICPNVSELEIMGGIEVIRKTSDGSED